MTFWSCRPVLVTGASGFLGRHLVEALLHDGATVTALALTAADHDPRVRRVHGLVQTVGAVERALAESGADTVFHLAAQALVGPAHWQPLETFETNIRGTYAVLDACRRAKVGRVIIASSDKAYGPVRGVATEATPLRGAHPYEVSKSCADLLAQSYWATYGLPLGIVRCCNLYGPGDLNYSRLIPCVIRAGVVGSRPVLRNTTGVREYLYVTDAVRAYLTLAERLAEPGICGEAFNVSSGIPLSVLQVVDAIQGLMDCLHLVPDVQGGDERELSVQMLSADKARQVLGWRPCVDFTRGLGETIAWYREHLSRGAAA